MHKPKIAEVFLQKKTNFTDTAVILAPQKVLHFSVIVLHIKLQPQETIISWYSLIIYFSDKYSWVCVSHCIGFVLFCIDVICQK